MAIGGALTGPDIDLPTIERGFDEKRKTMP